jgi:hypothetical protein
MGKKEGLRPFFCLWGIGRRDLEMNNSGQLYMAIDGSGRSELAKPVADLTSSPATKAVLLTAAMVSDTADLPTYVKALRIYNGSAAAVTLLVTPLRSADAVPITVPAGVSTLEPISVRRIWSTGSTGLVSGLTAGTVEVLLFTE